MCIRSSFQIIGQFAGMFFRIGKDAQQHMPGYEILITNLSNQRAINFNLLSFKQ